MTTLAHDAGPRTDVDVPAPVATPALAESSLPPTPGQVDKMLGAVSGAQIQETAQAGVAGAGQALPYADVIQRAFGKHDISNVRAHVGGDAARAAGTLGAKAYAFGVNQIAFASMPDLHTAAHEAAHAIQQRNGAVSGAGLGAADDTHERHADRVADKVVAGESAEALLDDTTRGGAAASGAVVQRKLADDLKARVLPQAIPLDQVYAGYPSPSWGAAMYSGPKRIVAEHRVTGAGPALQGALEAAAPSGPPAGGLVEDLMVANLRAQRSDLLAERAFEVRVGSPQSFATKSAPNVEHYLASLVYPSESGKTYTQTAELAYERSTDAPFTVLLEAGNVLAQTTGGVIKGVGTLATPADARLFGHATKPSAAPAILGDSKEMQAFMDALQPTGAEGLARWYGVVGAGVWDGKKSAREWFDATYKNGEVQLAVLRSLQQLHRQGVPAANQHMDDIVDTMRAIIDDPKTSASKRTIVEDRLLNSGVARHVTIDPAATTAVNSNPDKQQDTEDANFDRMRLAGEILARRELVPLLRACLDPVAFIKAHKVDRNDALGHDVAAWVIREAKKTGNVIDQFMESGLTSATLDPGDAMAPLPAGAIPHASRENARNAARLGAVEALRDAAAAVRPSSAAITGHMATHRGLLHVKERYNGASASARAVTVSADAGIAALVGTHVKADLVAIGRVSEPMETSGDADTQDRSVAVRNMRDVLGSDDVRTDLASLRKTTTHDKAQLQHASSVTAVQSVAYTQAIAAKTESNLAFTKAHDRFRSELLENVRGKFEEKEGGAKWVTGGLLVANAGKEGMELAKELLASTSKFASGLGKAIPGVGVAIAVVDAVLSFRDWRVKDKLAAARAKMEKEIADTMNASEKAMLAKIQGAAQMEVQVAADAKARPADGMHAYLATLATGADASPPAAVALSSLDQDSLDAFYTQLLSHAGPVQSELYQMYVGSIATAGKPLWERLASEIDELPEVSKK